MDSKGVGGCIRVFSQVSGGLSELGIVGVEHTLVHVLLLGNASDEDPEGKHDKDALPH